MNNPLVSIVLTNYNGEKYVGKAIESVIAQTYENWELIIIDDASTDDSLKVLHQYQDLRIQVRELPENSQVSYGHNVGNAMCRGEYIATIDNDDIWHEDKLEKQVQYMEKHPEVGVCFTLLDLIDAEGNPTEDLMEISIFEVENRSRESWLHELLTQGNHFLNDSSLIRTSVMKEIGENDLCLLQLHDLDMWLKIPQITEMYILQEPLVHYRWFSGSGSISQPSERNNNRTYFEYSYLIGNTVLKMEDNLFLRVFAEELVRKDAKAGFEAKCEKALLLMSDQLCTNVKNYAFELFHELFSSEEGKTLLKEKYAVTQHTVYALTGDPIFYDDHIHLKIADLEMKNRVLNKQLEIVQTSLSWRVTEPLRKGRGAAANVYHACRSALGTLKTSLLRIKKIMPGRKENRKESEYPGKGEDMGMAFPRNITFSILVPLYNTPVPFLREMIQSVQDQTYSKWELCLADGSDEQHPEVGEYCREMQKDSRIRYTRLQKNLGISGNTNACLDMASGEYIVLFDHDDLLLPEALSEVMKAICREGADYIYTDESVFMSPDRNQIISTHYKPDYAYDNLLSNNYICHLSAFSRELIEKAGVFRSEFDGSQDHDMILRLTNVAEHIVHIPKVLYLWRSHPQSVASDIGAKMYAVNSGRRAVHEFLRESRGITAPVDSSPAYPSMYHIHYPVKKNASVDIIVDISDTTQIERLQSELTTLTLFKRFKIRYVTDQPCTWKPKGYGGNATILRTQKHTRAQRLAEAAAKSKADYLVFMDENLRPLNTGWLTEMLMLASQSHIGAVGAKLTFRNDCIRHAGLVLGLGGHGLIGRYAKDTPPGSAGYFGQLAIVEDVTAVSCECMMISREHFIQAGGFSQEYSDVLFDADLCMRLRGLGLYNVYTPFAELEGGNNGEYSIDYGVEWPGYVQDAKVFRKYWDEEIKKGDPFYNPNFPLK